jgi:hypothetical protein
MNQKIDPQAAKTIALHPDHSNRSIAAMVGVDHKTVQALRTKDSVGEFPQHEKRTGTDGRTYKATHNPPAAKPDVTTSASKH